VVAGVAEGQGGFLTFYSRYFICFKLLVQRIGK